MTEKLVVYTNGDFAKGTFTKDKLPIGEVTYYTKDGTIFQGEFFNGKKEGKAKIEFQNGHFEGNYRNNKKHGFGTL